MNTTHQWIANATRQLAEGADPNSARLDAQLLVGHVTGHSRARLYAFPETVLTAAQLEELDALLQLRRQGKPLAYLTGNREFWSLALAITADVLIPRPDTEILVEKVLALESQLPSGCIIELGTGSGAIALALAQEIPHRPIIAVEKQPAAMAVASCNVTRFGHERVQLVQGNWLDAFKSGCAAMVIANPPYLADDDAHLPQLAHEPRSALVSGTSGLEDLHHIIRATRDVGKADSVLILEHGYQQAKDVQLLMANYNYTDIRTERDLAGLDRITYATMNATMNVTKNTAA